jgi:hypothetical protein
MFQSENTTSGIAFCIETSAAAPFSASSTSQSTPTCRSVRRTIIRIALLSSTIRTRMGNLLECRGPSAGRRPIRRRATVDI